MGRTKLLVISLILAVILFSGIVIVEKTLVNYTPKIEVVYCIKEVTRKEQLDSSSFTTKEVPITLVSSDTVKSLDAIKDMYAKDTIYTNEILNVKRIGTRDEVENYILNPGEREMAVTFENIEDIVGGTLRKDDKVDLLYTTMPTNTDPLPKTQTLKQVVRVLGAIDASGKYIDKYNKENVATTLLIAVKPDDGHIITNVLQSGKVKLFKVPDNDKTYDPITVINGQIIQGNTNIDDTQGR